MPLEDRTGPAGMGPRTGRGLGRCSPGFGWGHGWRHWARATGLPRWMRFGAAPEWPAPATPEDEVELLKAQAEQLQAQLDAVQSRLKDLQED